VKQLDIRLERCFIPPRHVAASELRCALPRRLGSQRLFIPPKTLEVTLTTSEWVRVRFSPSQKGHNRRIAKQYIYIYISLRLTLWIQVPPKILLFPNCTLSAFQAATWIQRVIYNHENFSVSWFFALVLRVENCWTYMKISIIPWKTNECPLKRDHFKRKGSSSNLGTCWFCGGVPSLIVDGRYLAFATVARMVPSDKDSQPDETRKKLGNFRSRITTVYES